MDSDAELEDEEYKSGVDNEEEISEDEDNTNKNNHLDARPPYEFFLRTGTTISTCEHERLLVRVMESFLVSLHCTRHDGQTRMRLLGKFSRKDPSYPQ